MSPIPLRVALAEDEPMNRKRLARLLEEAGCAVAGAFESGKALLAWLEQNPEVDALFLDIRMPGLSGLEVMEALDPRVPVVFVTAYAEHAVDAFAGEAVDYLLKPVSEERLARTLERLRARRPLPPPPAAPQPPPRRNTRYAVKAGEGLVFVDLSRTTHFEVVDEVVYAYAGGRFETPWKTLAAVEAHFPAAGLLRAHRHLLIRPEAVLGLKPSLNGRLLLTLSGGVELETSRGATPKVRERLGVP